MARDAFQTLEEYQAAFDAGRYDAICDSFCHEGYSVLDAKSWDNTPLDDQFIEVGVCSIGEKIPMREMPEEYHGHGWRLAALDFSCWPDRAKLALRKVCQDILKTFKDGVTGC